MQGIEGANRHVLIEGQSGSGKSLLTRHIAFERMGRGEDVYAVDPHNPEAWGGAKGVFQGEAAGAEAASFLRKLLEERKAEASTAKLEGRIPQFEAVTVAFSDFARLIKDSPQLQQELKTTLTEARKFNIAIIADTTAMTGAATGIKGIVDVINNFAQKVKLYAPSAGTPQRTAQVGGDTFQTPQLPDYKDRIDLGLVKPYTAPPVTNVEEERRERDAAESHARLLAQVARLDHDAARAREISLKEGLAKEKEAASAHARVLAEVVRLDREAAQQREVVRHAEEKAADASTKEALRREQSAAASHARLLLQVQRLDQQAAKEQAALQRDADLSHTRLLSRVARLDAEAAKEKAALQQEEARREQEAATSHARLLSEVSRLDKEAARESNARLVVRVAQLDREAAAQEAAAAREEAASNRLLARVVQLDREEREATEARMARLDAEAEQRKQGELQANVEFRKHEEARQAFAEDQKKRAEQEDAKRRREGEAEEEKQVRHHASIREALATQQAKEAAAQPKPVGPMDVVEALRGTLGGYGGKAVGAGLDLFKAVRGASGAAAEGAAGAEVGGGALAGLMSGAVAAGPVIAAAVAAVGVGIAAFQSLMKNIDEYAHRFEEYNAPIAAALAEAEVRETLGDMRRANEVSADMSRYIAAKTDVQQRYEDIKVKFMGAVLPSVTHILEVIDSIMPGMDGVAMAIRALLEPLSAIPGAVKSSADSIRDEMKPAPMDPTDELLKNDKFMDVYTGRPDGGFVPNA